MRDAIVGTMSTTRITCRGGALIEVFLDIHGIAIN